MKQNKLFFSLFIFSAALFLLHFAKVGRAIYGDGRYYYSYLPAFLIQHTLNLSQAFKHTNIASWFPTPLGFPANIYPIGPALFWAIPYILSYILGYFFGLTNPFALWIQIPIGIWVVGLVIIGLWLLTKILEKFFNREIALLTALTMFFTTNLLFYGAFDVLNSHAITFFLSTLLVYIWLKPTTTKTVLIQGVLIGLLMLTRSQEAIFFLLPFSTFLLRKKLVSIVSLIPALLLFLPQMLLWKVEWGSWLINPYLHVATFYFFSPQFLGVLFNPGSGLFLWTPITLLATLGLFLWSKKNPRVGLPMVAIFVGELYLIASWSIWWEGASYSARMFVSSIPFFAFGYAYLLSKKVFFRLRYFLLVFFGLLNVGLIIYFLLHR